jgi:peptidoglycan/xylan/chitin deacetylase (PgdA/CDA1 family)
VADLRAAAARAFDSAPVGWLLDALDWADRGRRGLIPVLTYHRIDVAAARPHLWPALISATPDAFERQIAYLAARRRPVTMAELLAARAGGPPLPRRAVLVTIDDAYADVAQHAWPVLARHGVPATLFVPTAAPTWQRGFWWDCLHHALGTSGRPTVTIAGRNFPIEDGADRAAAHVAAHAHIRSLPHAEAMAFVDGLTAELETRPAPPEILGWGALRELAAKGLTLAPHSRTHPRLDRIDRAAAEAEVRGSLADLEVEIGTTVSAFAYPSGDHGPPALEAVAAAGIDAAFTTRRGLVRVGSPERLLLPRLNVGRRTGLGALRAQLGSWMGIAGR